MAAWLAYFLGLATWFPIAVLAVVTGRLLARARERQTRAAELDRIPVRLAGIAAAPRDGREDAWAVAWADALS